MRILTCSSIILILFSLNFCTPDVEDKIDIKGELLLIKEIDYPSGSTLNFHNDQLYLMGDDATNLLILDTTFNSVKSVPMFGFGNGRISKRLKSDIESSEIIGNNLWFLGSGVRSPFRDSLVQVNLSTKNTRKLSLKAFYDSLRIDIENLNIEGFAKVKNQLVLGHRRTNLDPENYLITIPSNFLKNHKANETKFILFRPTKPETGISGMTYYRKKDMLFITCSKEENQNSYDDGDIGESSLTVITKASKKLSSDSISAVNDIQLSLIHKSFNNVKVESIAIAEVKRKDFIVYMVADNDNGKTILFKVKLTLNKL